MISVYGIFIESDKKRFSGDRRCRMATNWLQKCKEHRYLPIEGLHAKRAYVRFLADFHFVQDRANFEQTELF